MEFTEVQELNNITNIARSLQVRQLLPEGKSSFSQYRAPSVKPTEGTQIFDYEKALEDTPPDSPNKRYIAQITQSRQGATLVLGEKEESIEDILNAIQNTILQESEMLQVSLGLSNKIFRKDSPKKVEDISVESPKRGEDSPTDRKEEDQQQLQLKGLNDFGNKNFEKMRGDDVSKSYIETKNIKSFLSTSIKAFPMGSRQESSPIKRGDLKTYRVYFLTEKYSTLIPLTISSPISEIIKQCLEMFKLNKTINELLKYPDRPDAYELKKDNLTPPLDRSKSLRELRVAKELIVVEVANFDASKPIGEANAKGSSKDSEKNTPLNVLIYLPTDDKSILQVQMNSERLVKDIFARLALEGKAGYNQTNYNIRVYNSDPEARWKEAKNFLDANYPLKSIKPTNNKEIIELELVKKKFADEPSEPPIDHRKTSVSPKKRAGTVDITSEADDLILYNEVSANHYEEFEVVKINETGKRQDRILGIDGFKLYNYSKSYKQEQTGGIGDMFNTFFFSKFGTMNPERLLTDVLGAKLIGSKVFQITVIADAKEKYMSFEAKESRTAKQIVAKINYLKGLQAKKLNA